VDLNNFGNILFPKPFNLSNSICPTQIYPTQILINLRNFLITVTRVSFWDYRWVSFSTKQWIF